MKTSEKGLALIKHYEGFYSKAKQFKTGHGDIILGYGSTRHFDGRRVVFGDTITETEANDLLMYDLLFIEKKISRHFRGLNQDQFDALVSFTYSVGSGFLLVSQLKKKIQMNVKDPDIYNEWIKWSYDGRFKVEKLLNRRKSEYRLFSTGDLVFYDKEKKES